ncbi:MAG: heat-inducible transcriptional repressor HrcA [Actinomycetes bacterium]|jgi:heat-inducible transcriptional repressor
MLDERKTAILRAVVQEYVATGQPVGSGHIANLPSVTVSPATVRNELVALEQEGYLAQPHTSAGRIPTDKGYRHFVDSITPQGRLPEDEATQIGQFFQSAHGRMEDLLRHTTTLLANVTHHTAVVVGPEVEATTVRAVHISRVTARTATVVVVMSNHNVENETIQISEDITDAHIAEAVTHLSKVVVGHSLSDIESVPSTNDVHLDAVCFATASALARHRKDKPVFVGGAASLANAFDAVDVVRDVLATIEQQFVVVTLLQDLLDRGLSVAIGAEHGIQPLSACSVIVAPVVADGETIGSVGVLGPTRMDYPQALNTVEVVSEQLGRHIAEGAA